MHAIKTQGWISVFFVACAAMVGATSAGTISVSWDPVPNASGYRVYYGTESGHYDTFKDVGQATEGMLTQLPNCTRHYVAVKAYNGAGESAQFSNEVSGLPRPKINSHEPLAAMQGHQFVLSLLGANFEPGASLIWDPANVPADLAGNPLIRFEAVQVVSCREIQALVTVEPTASGFRAMPLGTFRLPVEVVNPDSVFGAGEAVIEIEFRRYRADINRSDAETRDRVDGKDLSWLAYSHGTREGQPAFNPDADLSGDGQVDGEDLALLAPFFGKCWAGANWKEDACP